MTRRIWMLLAFLAFGAGAAHAVQLKVSLSEISQTADLIFIGTVTGQSTRLSATKTMPVTDVSFGDIEVVHATTRSTQRNAATVTLTYAGGRIGETTVTVSDTPNFIEGRRYLVFVSDDGQPYLTPIVGGRQGQFEILADRVTSESYVLTADGRTVVDIAQDDIVASPSRVSAIESGVPVATDAAASESREAGDPLAAGRGDSYRPAEARKMRAPMLLSTFLDHLRKVALKDEDRLASHPAKRGRAVLSRGEWACGGRAAAGPEDEGHFAAVGARRAAVALGRAAVVLGRVAVALGRAGRRADRRHVDEWRQPLLVRPAGAPRHHGAGQHELVGVGHQQLLDVDVEPDHGRVPLHRRRRHVQLAERSLSAERVHRVPVERRPREQVRLRVGRHDAGRHLDMELVSLLRHPGIRSRVEPGLQLDGQLQLLAGQQRGRLQRPNTMHELGHTIGHQREDGETYDYDQPSVMHAYYNNVVEDGYGVHEGDAWIMRRNYQDDRSILGFADVGVESYYASNGLRNSTPSSAWLRPGDSITVSNVTVENISYGAQADVRIRFFLSPDKTITPGDRQMGSYWYWPSFCGECYNVGSYAMSIPSATPPGTYYIGAIVTRNGFGGDDYWPNDQTFLYDTVTVTCAGSYSLSSTNNSVLRPGESANFGVSTTGSACSWSATDDASWITIASGASGIGNGTVSYRVAANTGPARTGHIYAAGLTHTVTQQAGCLTSAASPIGMWGSASGQLSTSDCLSRYRVVSTDLRPYADHYTFSGTAGHRVAIVATSGSFDGYMYLVGPTGSVVAFDDDGAGYPNARIPAGTGYYTLPSTGTYTIEVTSYSINAVGAYTLKLMAPVTLTISPASGVVTGCRAAQGKIVLGKVAPAGGLTLSITDTLAAASPPSTVTIAAGVLEESFTITTTPVLSTQSGTVTARFGGTGGVSSTDALSIRPISVETLTLTPNPVVGPNSSIGAIVLECSAGPQAITVSLGTTNASVAWPAVTSVTIPVGAKNRSFTVRTADVSTVRNATIKATANGRTKTKTLTVQ